MSKSTKNFIDNQFVDAEGASTIEVRNPATNELLGVVPALALPPGTPILEVDARNREMVKRVLIRVAEYALITAMLGYWSRFAHTGDPNGPGAVPWPTYEPVTDRYLELGDAVISGEGVHADDCDFWDSLE